MNIHVRNGDTTDFMDVDLPMPSYLIPMSGAGGYLIGYCIEGIAGGNKAKTYFNDINMKISLLLGGEPSDDTPTDFAGYHHNPKPYKLSRFNHVEDLRPKRSRNWSEKLLSLHVSEDTYFDAIRLEAYSLKRAGMLTLQVLTNYAQSILPASKSPSTANTKAKNIYNWTMNRYNAGSGRVSTMNRTEASNLARGIRSDRTKDRIFSYLQGLKSLGASVEQLSCNAVSFSIGSQWKTTKKYLLHYQNIQQAMKMLKEPTPLIRRLKDRTLTKISKTIEKGLVWLTADEYLRYILVTVEDCSIQDHIKKE